MKSCVVRVTKQNMCDWSAKYFKTKTVTKFLTGSMCKKWKMFAQKFLQTKTGMENVLRDLFSSCELEQQVFEQRNKNQTLRVSNRIDLFVLKNISGKLRHMFLQTDRTDASLKHVCWKVSQRIQLNHEWPNSFFPCQEQQHLCEQEMKTCDTSVTKRIEVQVLKIISEKLRQTKSNLLTCEPLHFFLRNFLAIFRTAKRKQNSSCGKRKNLSNN